eukprot:1159448-Pelagomonas_calceolata.AAC.2
MPRALNRACAPPAHHLPLLTASMLSLPLPQDRHHGARSQTGIRTQVPSTACLTSTTQAGSSPRKISFVRRHPAPHEQPRSGTTTLRGIPGGGSDSIPVTFVKLPEPVRFVANST